MTSAHQSFESLQKISLNENRRRHSDTYALSCHGAKFTSGEGSDCSEDESASSSSTESWADLSLDLHFSQASKDREEPSGQFKLNISGALQIDSLLPDAEALLALSISSLSPKLTDPTEDLPSETEERCQVAKEDTGLSVHLRIMY